MYFVYLLKSDIDSKLYVGFTVNLKKRIERHNRGEANSTKFRKPFKLLYFEGFNNKKDALSREKYLKSGYGKEQLKNILKNSL